MQVNLQLEIFNIPRTLVFAEMPILRSSIRELFDYPVTADIAICIPVFNATLTKKHAIQTTFGHVNKVHGYAKRAMYLVRELLNYTDVREQGIPIYVVCTSETKKIVGLYAEACNFPKSQLVFAGKDIERNYPAQLAKFPCMEMVLKTNRKISKVMHLDTSVFFWENIRYTFFSNLISVWENQFFASLVAFRRCVNPDKPFGSLNYRSHRRSFSFDKYPLAESTYYDQLSEIMGFSSTEAMFAATHDQMAMVQGQSFGLHRHIWEREAFNDFLTAFKSINQCDEAAVAAFWYLTTNNFDDCVLAGAGWCGVTDESPLAENQVGFLSAGDAHQFREEFIQLTTGEK